MVSTPNHDVYSCPECGGSISADDISMFCNLGHSFVRDKNRNLVRFLCNAVAPDDYTPAQAADIHDRALTWLLAAHGLSESSFREDILAPLKLSPGMRVLVTGVGAGNDLPFIAKKISPGGEIYAVDIAENMLLAAVDRVGSVEKTHGIRVEYSLGDAVKLPFKSASFDAVYHFGGLNLFSDIPKSISEMDRVAKENARVVFGDEGMAEWLANCEVGKMLLTNNPLYRYRPPIFALPQFARSVSLTWVINNCYYLISYTSFKEPLKIDIDLKHQGLRGGSLRTRYFGQLEGVSPQLKEQIYGFAKRQGLSRADAIEELLRSGLDAERRNDN